MSDCIFCKIAAKKIPSTIVFENEKVLAFRDIAPLAKEHILFISKNHSKDLNEMNLEDVTEVFRAIKEYSKNLESDYRVVTNVGKEAGQSVFHTHFHLLSKEPLGSFNSDN